MTIQKLKSASDVVNANSVASLFALALCVFPSTNPGVPVSLTCTCLWQLSLALLPTWGPAQRLFQKAISAEPIEEGGWTKKEELDERRDDDDKEKV